jgi:syndecan 1
MRAAVVVILATITGIVALLNIKSESVLNGFGAVANNGAGQVVAVPQPDGGVAQGRVQPQVGPRPSRSGEQRSQLPDASGGTQPLPKGCRVAINGEEIAVTSSNGRTVNLAVPENGTLTLRCEADGVRSRRSGKQAPTDPDQVTPGQQAPGQGDPGQGAAGQQGSGQQGSGQEGSVQDGSGKPKPGPNDPPAGQDPANPGADPQNDPAGQAGNGTGS